MEFEENEEKLEVSLNTIPNQYNYNISAVSILNIMEPECSPSTLILQIKVSATHSHARTHPEPL
jgi:hypothetical protein